MGNLKKGEKLMEKEYNVIKSFFIAGVQHHEMKTVLGEIEDGNIFALIREPSNKYDPNAVRIEYPTEDGSVMLGYVPAKFSSEIGAYIEIGRKLSCVVVELNKAAKPWEWCRVEIREVIGCI